jgi:hypothetical protein
MRLSFRDMIASLRRDVFSSKGPRRPRPASFPQPLRPPLPVKSVLKAASWHPAKAPDGSSQTLIVVDLECTNKTNSPVHVVSARLRHHAAEQTTVLVRAFDRQSIARDLFIPADRIADLRATFFVAGRPHRPGEWFNEVVILADEKEREHRLKISVRGK